MKAGLKGFILVLALAFLLVCTDLRTCVVIENQALENKFNRNIVAYNATTSDIGSVMIISYCRFFCHHHESIPIGKKGKP